MWLTASVLSVNIHLIWYDSRKITSLVGIHVILRILCTISYFFGWVKAIQMIQIIRNAKITNFWRPTYYTIDLSLENNRIYWPISMAPKWPLECFESWTFKQILTEKNLYKTLLENELQYENVDILKRRSSSTMGPTLSVSIYSLIIKLWGSKIKEIGP